jgi:hypothetical protein
MGFSGGSNQGSSSSTGYGYNQSLAESLNASNQTVWGPQGQALEGLYKQAGQLAGGQANAGQVAQGLVDKNMGAVNGGIGALQDIAAGGGALANYANPNNELAQRMLGDASNAIGENFNRVVLPGITSAAGQVGGIGGSREALARGVAGGDAANAIGRAATDIYGQQYALGAQAAAGLQDARLSAAQALPGAAAGAVNMGMSPYAAAWAPLQSMAGIFAQGPTTLNQSFGVSRAQGQSENWQSATSSQKGNQWGFNLF